MTEPFKQIDATPYAWPFDGQWSAADSAVILLGFQTGLIAELGAQEELSCALRAAEAAKAAGLPVFASQRAGNPSQQEAGNGPVPHGPVADEIIALAEPDLVTHARDNVFFNASLDLDALLRKRGIRNLIFAGLPTDGLLHASMRAANDKGFECLAVSDACKGTFTTRHSAQLRITTFGNGLFGVVAPAQPLIDALSGQS
nr:isochorismatase family protein [uncultured Cohaesibacter sp.]